MVVYVLNFIDRQILVILAEDIKADLGLTDAQMGFLYGTTFAIFYAVFGIPLGRLADRWDRRKLIASGLAIWSAFTALSGTAASLFSLSTYRTFVGIGESSASPASYSLLYDYFPARLRATVMSIYSGGVYIGVGLSLFIGGWILDAWHQAYDQGGAPFGLKGWQAALMIVALPGMVLSIAVWKISEPARDSVLTSAREALGFVLAETARLVPPFSLMALARDPDHRRSPLLLNALCIVGLTLLSAQLIKLTGDAQQWAAIAIGLYTLFSWAQSLYLREPDNFRSIFRNNALLCCMAGCSFIAFVSYGAGFWLASYFIRHFGLNVADVGLNLGLSAAIGGWSGVVAGGVVSDFLQRRLVIGRMITILLSAAISALSLAMLLRTDNITTAYALQFAYMFGSSFWLGGGITFVNESVSPQLRSTASAFLLFTVTMIGLAMGPYIIGQMSDQQIALGATPAAALSFGIEQSLWSYVAASLLAVMAAYFHYKTTNAADS